MAGRLLYGDPVSRIRLDLAPTAPVAQPAARNVTKKTVRLILGVY